MVNKFMGVGRLTNDPQLKETSTGKQMAQFTLAINRFGKDAEADFIRITCWDKTAENVSRMLTKGRLVHVEGSIRTGSYDDNDGKKVYTTDIYATNVTFLDSRRRDDGADDAVKDVFGSGIDDMDIPF